MTQRRTPVCPNGHDKDVLGRRPNGCCATCARLRYRRRQRRKKGEHVETPELLLFSPWPVLEQIRLRGSWADHITPMDIATTPFDGDSSVARQYAMAYPDVSMMSVERTLQRMRAGRRLSMDSADRWACFLGLHPCLLWDNWFDGVQEEEVA